MVEMLLEHLKLIRCPLITPISETEIVFLRFGHPENVSKQSRWMTPYTPGGVAIYNIVTGNVTDVAEISGFAFVSQISTCTISKKGQIAAIV